MEKELVTAGRRQFKRFGILGSVVLRSNIAAPPLPATLYDLSFAGCLLWMSSRNAFCEAEFIEVVLRFDTLTFRTLARVAYTSDGGQLLGVEFLRLSERTSDELSAFLTRLEQLEEANCT